jgi:recombinational DNA repair protein (RecF pathway)
MSHHKHTIEAFILSVTPAREHDARVKVVTKDGEVLSAIATGLRTLKSKLRMSLVPFTHVSISLVRGKDIWRLTNATSISNIYNDIRDKEYKKAFARSVSLVEKLTPGEMHVGMLFEKLLMYGEQLIAESDSPDSSRRKAYETRAAIILLSELGYIEHAERWVNADIEYIEANIKVAIQDVNHGIQSTHLA